MKKFVLLILLFNTFRCIYRDYVKLFLNLPQGAVNENNTHNQLLCGKIVDIEQTFYSSHSTLAFEFHSDWRSGNNTGFRGTFRFLNKSKPIDLC